MSADFRIVEAEIKKTLPPTEQRPNALVIWNLRVQDEQGNVIACERSKRPENSLSVGQMLHGYIEEREGYPPAFKETQRNGGGGPTQPQWQQSVPQQAPPPEQPSFHEVPPIAYPTVPGPTGKPPKEKDPYERRPDHPINAARARHAAAMGSTPDYYRLFREEQILNKPGDFEQMQQVLARLMAWLEATYPADPRDEETPPF